MSRRADISLSLSLSLFFNCF
ncbi:hypothetical protein V1478_001824 [Vespula squamosa]|uniref:Uncharacterized protein n=1 Tax=Vespula squamosa TaxID=30214 RepID=A0ABD2BY80_VESSQ